MKMVEKIVMEFEVILQGQYINSKFTATDGIHTNVRNLNLRVIEAILRRPSSDVSLSMDYVRIFLLVVSIVDA